MNVLASGKKKRGHPVVKVSILDNRYCPQILIRVWWPYLARLFIKESLEVKISTVQDMWSPRRIG